MTRPRMVLLPEWMLSRPFTDERTFLPSSWIPYTALFPSGRVFALDPGWLKPSIITGSVMSGSNSLSRIVWRPEPGISKLIMSGPGWLLAAWIAARSVHRLKTRWVQKPKSISPGVSTVMIDVSTSPTAIRAENSEVLPWGSVAVAVAVITRRSATLAGSVIEKGAKPSEPVVTGAVP